MLLLFSHALAGPPGTTWNVVEGSGPTLGEVLIKVQDSDTVVIGPGTFDADITVIGTDDLTIVGAGPSTGGTLIRAVKLDPQALFSNCSNLEVRDLAISGQDKVRVASLAGNTTAMFRNVRFEQGIGNTFDGGSALRVDATSEVELLDCLFENNATGEYGTVRVLGSANVQNTRFEANSAQIGAGMYCGAKSTCEVYDSWFQGGTADRGAGIYFEDAVSGSVLRSTFCDLRVNGTLNATGDGAGLMFRNTPGSVSNNTFVHNVAEDNASGVYVLYSDVTLQNNTFIGNSAAGNGAGVFVWGPGTHATLVNNLFIDHESLDPKDAATISVRIKSTTSGTHNLFWNSTPADLDSRAFLENTVTGQDPLVYGISGSCYDGGLLPDPAGPTHDGGSPDILDPDGSRSDIGATGGPLAYRDRDGDGSIDGQDCDDLDASRSPDFQEVCGGGDDDCDELVDEEDDSLDLGTLSSGFEDNDGDGVGGLAVEGCELGPLVEVGGDCDDDEPDVFPGAAELCDTLDNNCDGRVDEMCAEPRDVPVRGDEPTPDGCSCSTPSGPAGWMPFSLLIALIGRERSSRQSVQ